MKGKVLGANDRLAMVSDHHNTFDTLTPAGIQVPTTSVPVLAIRGSVAGMVGYNLIPSWMTACR